MPERNDSERCVPVQQLYFDANSARNDPMQFRSCTMQNTLFTQRAVPGCRVRSRSNTYRRSCCALLTKKQNTCRQRGSQQAEHTPPADRKNNTSSSASVDGSQPQPGISGTAAQGQQQRNGTAIVWVKRGGITSCCKLQLIRLS